MWSSTKTYGHNEGLSCAFRQWRAQGYSHCSLLHGYSLLVRLVFISDKLDQRNWVMDFGGLKELKQWLHDMFDHTTLVASDDPELKIFEELHTKGIIHLKEVEHVGCEKFAELIWHKASEIVAMATGGQVAVYSCEVQEHEGNSAIYSLPRVWRP
jgi:6-pyruvoyltetrahydropterin/6-carboxytetrahydropterin synthase